MPISVWSKAVRLSADPPRARAFLKQLQAGPAWPDLQGAEADRAQLVAGLLAGSQALGEALIRHPEWATGLTPELLQHPRRDQGFRREIAAWLGPLLARQEFAAAGDRLREFKQREQLRIAARDLARYGDALAITRELSDVADACLDAAFRIAWQAAVGRHGAPFHQDPEGGWHPTAFTVLGMGKLGGQELNYSSDIDLLFVYSEEGSTFRESPRRRQLPPRGIPNHQFFKRMVELLVGELTRVSTFGALYRVDLRLRPEGDTGPLARSLASYENYYAQWGQTWERMMLIKARGVAGDATLAAEFLETVQSFRYPRSLAPGALREVAAMKQRIEREVVKVGEIDRNVKLGRGGIREVEFIAQTLQLLHAGRLPFLQGSQSLPTLGKLVQYELLQSADAQALSRAYLFLRDVEHRLQMENNLQTHTIPVDRPGRVRLARLMGFPKIEDFAARLREHTGQVRRVYDAFLGREEPEEDTTLPPVFAGLDAAWRALLEQHSFKQVDKSLRVLVTFVQGPGYGHVSTRTSELARQLVRRLLALCPRRVATGGLVLRSTSLSDPDRVLARLDSYIQAYGARATLYEAWVSNPSLFDLLVLLFDRSEYLAEIAIRTPDLIDELELSGQLRRPKNTAGILADLRHGRSDEDQPLWLRRYHQAELMRLGLRHILGLADFEQNLVELSGLADACVEYALQVVMRRHKLRAPPFAVIGLGKLGGAELNYGSDLDVLFVAGRSTRNLPALQKLAVELMEMLGSTTEYGVAFPIDARLRPDGEKGLLVNTLGAYEEYYRQRALLWEIQALSRARAIAGDTTVGTRFEQLAATLANFQTRPEPLAAYRPDWREEIARMRLRIQKERTPAGKDRLAIKTGVGGLIDAEFVAQVMCLAQGWHEPNTLRALDRAREARLLNPEDATQLVLHYRKLREVEGILRRWSFAGETLLPDDPAPLYRVAIRCGYEGPEAFLEALGSWRAAIRAVYDRVLPASTAREPTPPGRGSASG